MKTIQLSEKELATLKAAVWAQIQNVNKDIRFAQEQGKDDSFLLELKREFEEVFEAFKVCKLKKERKEIKHERICNSCRRENNSFYESESK
ncbi:hypothetical protein [Saccharococcus caldoxylosilyticus]|jgi:hypothetical protein|uniref:hypothetical protein n=1 Tax=Saccharococcus caldoxylosilyticus TaxID=81408 RepID=UPI001FCCB18D|nr:hypothetical protein [Parageobacillus caldoxylosilyticus]